MSNSAVLGNSQTLARRDGRTGGNEERGRARHPGEVRLTAVSTSQSQEETRVSVEGDLDLTSVPAFRAAVDEAVETREKKRLVVDLRQTSYIDSAGLEQLLAANRKLAAQGDRLTVRVLPGSQPQTVLGVVGFGTIMDVEPATGAE